MLFRFFITRPRISKICYVNTFVSSVFYPNDVERVKNRNNIYFYRNGFSVFAAPYTGIRCEIFERRRFGTYYTRCTITRGECVTRCHSSTSIVRTSHRYYVVNLLSCSFKFFSSLCFRFRCIRYAQKSSGLSVRKQYSFDNSKTYYFNVLLHACTGRDGRC